jgi:cytidyltransferase-like protein
MDKKVMVFGTFDILHLGHIDLFKQAKQYGDVLFVVVATDARTTTIKKTAPLHTQKERKQLLESIQNIDTVMLGDSDDVYKAIRQERPDIIALGYDQQLFVEKLEIMLEEEKLDNTQIVRLKAYQPEKHKSTKIRSYIEQHI